MAGPASAENLQGFASGFTSRSIDPPESGVPLLQSFYFRYTDSDHHLRAIDIEPNAPSVNEARIGYADENGDDQFFYNIDLQRYSGRIFEQTHGREVCTGRCTKTILAPADRENHVFVIRGFYIFFHGDDHHIDQIGIQEDDGQVTVSFNDQDDNDTFLWDLHYAYIPRSRVADIGARSGNARGAQRVSIRSGPAVIRGFNFDFTSKDHHIKDIGIQMTGNGQLSVFYGDREPDDSFAWQVRYAITRPARASIYEEAIPTPLSWLESAMSGRP